MKLLLIEDNDALGHWLGKLLKDERFAVDIAADGEAADRLLKGEQYDVVLLDLMLPLLSGKQVLRRLRARKDNVPVMVLTASGSTDEKVECLGAGADDYLVKPFDVRELVARINALVRRRTGETPAEIACADLVYDTGTRQFQIGGTPLALRPREHAVLEILMRQLGRTVSKNTLMQGIFGMGDEPSEDAIEIYVHRLRKKLEACGAAIMTLRGLGYLLQKK